MKPVYPPRAIILVGDTKNVRTPQTDKAWLNHLLESKGYNLLINDGTLSITLTFKDGQVHYYIEVTF